MFMYTLIKSFGNLMNPSTVIFSENRILKVIRKLDPNKAHGQDKISIGLIKLSVKAISKPLYMNFTSWLERSVFPNN